MEKSMDKLNVYKVYRLLFDLLEDQEGVEIAFTLRKKEEEKEGVKNDKTKL